MIFSTLLFLLLMVSIVTNPDLTIRGGDSAREGY